MQARGIELVQLWLVDDLKWTIVSDEKWIVLHKMVSLISHEYSPQYLVSLRNNIGRISLMMCVAQHVVTIH